jgi:hypothetical protein
MLLKSIFIGIHQEETKKGGKTQRQWNCGNKNKQGTKK